MSQVAKSVSALERAFLAILVLELEAMVVRLFRPLKFAGVDRDRWTVRLGISIDVKCPAWRVGICPCRRSAQASAAWAIVRLRLAWSEIL
jgi:hypothetical protein